MTAAGGSIGGLLDWGSTDFAFFLAIATSCYLAGKPTERLPPRAHAAADSVGGASGPSWGDPAQFTTESYGMCKIVNNFRINFK